MTAVKLSTAFTFDFDGNDFTKNDIEAVINMKTNMYEDQDEDFLKFLENEDYSTADDKAFALNIWNQFNNFKILSKVFSQFPEFFSDEVEDFLIEELKTFRAYFGGPKFLHFAANHQPAFDLLIRILVNYAFETKYEVKIIDIISKMICKLHQLAPNPVELYPSHLQHLVILLLSNPDDLVDNLSNICPKICDYWSQINKKYPIQSQILAILFTPWLNIVFKSCPKFSFTFLSLQNLTKTTKMMID
jgi:hypothetical protein